MSSDLLTELQALYGSGSITGFLSSFLPKEGLKKGWVEQGLAYKGLKSSISTKANQTKYVIPTEHLVRLMCDRAMDSAGSFGLAITGSRGLRKEKFCVILSDSYDKKGTKLATSLWTKSHSPQEIVQLVNRYEPGVPPKEDFQEPKIDYIEQLKVDSSDGKVNEALALQIPKKLADEATWIKGSLGMKEGESDSLLYQHGKLKDTPAFALLFSKSLSGLRLVKPAKETIFASLLKKDNLIEVVLWDQPREIAIFAVFKSNSIGELTWKYLLPVWALPDERIEPVKTKELPAPSKSDEAPLDSEDSIAVPSDDTLRVLGKKIEALEHQLDDVSVPKLLMKLEQAERRAESLRVAVGRLSELEQALEQANAQDIQDQSSLGLLQNRLEDLLNRMESLSSKLAILDERIRNLGADLSE